MVTVAASGDDQIHSCSAFFIFRIAKANQDILKCIPDKVPGACVLTLRHEDLGQSSENVITDLSEPTSGKYFLMDFKYKNIPGFIAPYAGAPYGLLEHENGFKPQDDTELFKLNFLVV
ncbi:hypothetical protein Tco_1074063 [Tanacetum coccineum]